MRDGTFGTTADCPPLADDVVARGRGAQLRAARAALLAQQRPRFLQRRRAAGQPDRAAARAGPGARQRRLRPGNAGGAGARARRSARSPAAARRVRLLWDACQIPDFRKLADDTHTRPVRPRVRPRRARAGGCRPTGWPARSPALARADGDIDTLMQRLAGVRVWSYIAARADWVPDAAALAGPRARGRGPAVRRAARAADQPLRRSPRRPPDAPAGGGRGRGPALRRHPPRRGGGRGPSGRPCRRLRLRARPGGGGRRAQAGAARRAPGAARGDAAPRRAAGGRARRRVRAAARSQRITWDGAPVARLRPGPSRCGRRWGCSTASSSTARSASGCGRGCSASSMTGCAQAWRRCSRPRRRRMRDGALRGPLHRLTEGLGVVPRRRPSDDIPPALRGRLKAIGVRAGRLRAVRAGAAEAARGRTARAAVGARARRAAPALPARRRWSRSPPPADWPAGFAAAMGWVEAGPVLLRLDVAERVAAELAYAAPPAARSPVPAGLAVAARGEGGDAAGGAARGWASGCCRRRRWPTGSSARPRPP